MIKYGLISDTDARTIEKTLDLICDGIDGTINVTEVGLYNCESSNGISDYVWEYHKMRVNYTGIDNQKDKEIIAPDWMNLIIGDSNEVYNQLEDESQHMIVIDGNHSFPYVVSDYYCYKNKVKVGGFLCFHDASPQAQGRDWQLIGNESDPDMSISVMKALTEIGIWESKQWETTFHLWDEDDRCGGFAIFKKLY